MLCNSYAHVFNLECSNSSALNVELSNSNAHIVNLELSNSSPSIFNWELSCSHHPMLTNWHMWLEDSIIHKISLFTLQFLLLLKTFASSSLTLFANTFHLLYFEITFDFILLLTITFCFYILSLETNMIFHLIDCN